MYTIDDTGTEKRYFSVSRFIYQALEPTEMIQLSYDDLATIVSKNKKLEELRKDFLLKMLQETLEQLEAFVLLTPEERYTQFLESRSNIVNRVPDKYIANIIGVTPQSLSRIRKRMAQKGH